MWAATAPTGAPLSKPWSRRRKSYVDVSVESLEALADSDAGSAVKRPVNAELSARKVLATFGIKQQPWRRGIQEALKVLYEPQVEDAQ